MEVKAIRPEKSEKDCQTDEPEEKAFSQVMFKVQHEILTLVKSDGHVHLP